MRTRDEGFCNVFPFLLFCDIVAFFFASSWKMFNFTRTIIYFKVKIW